LSQIHSHSQNPFYHHLISFPIPQIRINLSIIYHLKSPNSHRHPKISTIISLVFFPTLQPLLVLSIPYLKLKPEIILKKFKKFKKFKKK
jgi:hypothetical protein